MSIDSWGGGSDNDPKLRKKELGAYVPDPLNNPGHKRPVRPVGKNADRKKPALRLVDSIAIWLIIGGCLIAAYRHFN